MPSPFQPATTIDEVIERLNAIIDEGIQNSSALAIFPALYLVVTEKVKEGIVRGDVFEDGPRMEQLDVHFANYFLRALHQFTNDEKPMKSWKLGFNSAVKFKRYLILQQLLIAMNPHINLDLGMAAAQTCPGDQIEGLKADFMAINGILSSLVDEIKSDLEKLSPRFSRFLRFFKGKEDAMLNFSIRKARDAAWDFAVKLAHADEQEAERLIGKKDGETLVLGNLIVRPGILVLLLVWWIKFGEEKDIGTIVTELRTKCAARVRFHVDS